MYSICVLLRDSGVEPMEKQQMNTVEMETGIRVYCSQDRSFETQVPDVSIEGELHCLNKKQSQGFPSLGKKLSFLVLCYDTA